MKNLDVETRERARKGCSALVGVCADLKPFESALVLSDRDTSDIGAMLGETASTVSNRVEHSVIEPLAMHGQEPPTEIARAMGKHDVVFGLTRMSLAHTKARADASRGGMRYLSLPDYSWSVISCEALQADFRGLTDVAFRLAEVFSKGSEIVVQTASGTHLRCRIDERVGNPAPGWCFAKGTLASPPDAEANVAPLENASEGTVVVDGSIPCRELGLLSEPVVLTVERGCVVRIEGKNAAVLDGLFDRPRDPKSRIVAEIGVGLNQRARLSGAMLEDEGAAGTVHIGIGANIVLGGKNQVPFHLDHVIRNASLSVDGVAVMRDGELEEAFAR